MKKFIETILNIYNIEELRGRIITTLTLLLVYRLGAQVVLPGIDSVQLAELSNRTDGGGLLGILNAFTGGAFANASVFALGIMPYISASIVVQLMGIAVPYLQKLQKEGESGNRKRTQITRWLTILICVVQAPAYLYGLSALGVPDSAFVLGRGPLFMFSSVIILVTGTIFAMWLGEKITDKVAKGGQIPAYSFTPPDPNAYNPPTRLEKSKDVWVVQGSSEIGLANFRLHGDHWESAKCQSSGQNHGFLFRKVIVSQCFSKSTNTFLIKHLGYKRHISVHLAIRIVSARSSFCVCFQSFF